MFIISRQWAWNLWFCLLVLSFLKIVEHKAKLSVLPFTSIA